MGKRRTKGTRRSKQRRPKHSPAPRVITLAQLKRRPPAPETEDQRAARADLLVRTITGPGSVASIERMAKALEEQNARGRHQDFLRRIGALNRPVSAPPTASMPKPPHLPDDLLVAFLKSEHGQSLTPGKLEPTLDDLAKRLHKAHPEYNKIAGNTLGTRIRALKSKKIIG
jgi:hypothetical protein